MTAPKPAPAAEPQTDEEKYDDFKCLACGENYDTRPCPSCFPAQQSASSAQGEGDSAWCVAEAESLVGNKSMKAIVGSLMAACHRGAEREKAKWEKKNE